MTGPSYLEAVLQKAKDVAGDPMRFGVYESNPLGFTTDVLGVDLWAKQKEIVTAVWTRRRVSIRSGHGVSKTHTMAAISLTWLYARRGLVVTTASTWDQVQDVLWREINEQASRSRVPLPGSESLTERRINNSWYAVGISTNKANAFQGRHHPRLLVVVDEASGVAEQSHLEISTLATGVENHIVMVGNPTELSGTFYESHKHPEIWHTIHISCFDHPNVVEGREIIKGAVTREWIEERRVAWGEAHPLWSSRVLGEFPRFSDKGVIPLAWAERAQDQSRFRWDDDGPVPDKQGQTKRERALAQAKAQNLRPMIALDVARYGQCKCVMGLRYGDAVESIEVWDHTSTMETCGKVFNLWRATNASMVVVDESGVGGGVVDRLAELPAEPGLGTIPVFGYNSGHRAFTPGQYASRRSELWWLVRRRLEHERLHYPVTPQLIADLVAPNYKVKSSGRIHVETKEDLLDRNIKSPDFADMLVMLFADSDPVAFEEELRAEPVQDPQAWEQENADPAETSQFDQFPAGY